MLDALEQALYAREPERDGALIHHSDRGSQYLSIRYSERLAEVGIQGPVGSKGDSYDNALAKTITGLFKTELIHDRAPCETKEGANWPRSNGLVVQPPSPAGAHRLRPAGRGLGKLLPATRRTSGRTGLTYTNRPPRMPGDSFVSVA